jgi:hypothetical protein
MVSAWATANHRSLWQVVPNMPRPVLPIDASELVEGPAGVALVASMILMPAVPSTPTWCRASTRYRPAPRPCCRSTWEAGRCPLRINIERFGLDQRRGGKLVGWMKYVVTTALRNGRPSSDCLSSGARRNLKFRPGRMYKNRQLARGAPPGSSRSLCTLSRSLIESAGSAAKSGPTRRQQHGNKPQRAVERLGNKPSASDVWPVAGGTTTQTRGESSASTPA